MTDVKWDGRYVAGVSKISALKRTTEVVERAVAIEHIVLQHEGWERDLDVTGTGDTKQRGW